MSFGSGFVDMVLAALHLRNTPPSSLEAAIERATADHEAADKDGWIPLTPRQRSWMRRRP